MLNLIIAIALPLLSLVGPRALWLTLGSSQLVSQSVVLGLLLSRLLLEVVQLHL